MKTFIKSVAAVFLLSGILNAGGVTLVGVGAGVNVLGLQVGAAAAVDIGVASYPVETSSVAVESDSKCTACVSSTCCFKVKNSCPPFLFDNAGVEERVVTVEEYYVVDGCPVCVSCN